MRFSAAQSCRLRSRLSRACARPRRQVSRFNALNAERERKLKAGEAVPPLVSEQVRLDASHDSHLAREIWHPADTPRSAARDCSSRVWQMKKGEVQLPWTTAKL